MTDRSREPGRIDLRAIDSPSDPLQAERVIAAAMSRMAAERESKGDVVVSLMSYSRPIFAAAAALILIATGALIVTQKPAEADTSANLVATWAQSGHVPTNGELLAAFQGYDR